MTNKGGIIIGYLSGGDTRIEFTRSIGAVTAYSLSHEVPLVGALPHVSGPRIAAGRNHLVNSFLATEAEWLFMVDDDMSFDGDVLERFLKVADPVKAPIVGGLTFGTGRDGIFPTLFRVDPEVQGPVRMDSWPLDPNSSLVEVDATGAACLFVHRSVFEKMGEQYGGPWKWFQETALGGNTVGEDMTFCLRARALGFPIVVDTSIKFGHVKPRVIDEHEYFRWLDTHRILVTGTGRCGLAYMARCLHVNRIRVGVHQLFTLEGRVGNPFARGDVSWTAPPFLDRFTGYVLHTVRHPVPTVLSLAEVFAAEDAELMGFVGEHAPVILDYESVLDRAAAWYLEWNRRIEPYAHQRIQVENVTGPDLYDMVRYSGAFHAPWELQQYVDLVTKPEPADTDWGRLDGCGLVDELKVMGKEYGYE